MAHLSYCEHRVRKGKGCEYCLGDEKQKTSNLQARVKELERSLKVAESDRDTFKRYAAKMEPVVEAARDVEKIYWDFEKTMAPQVTVLKKALRELDDEKNECPACTRGEYPHRNCILR